MVRLNLKAVEDRVAPLAGRDSYDREFIFDLLLAYGKPQGNVTRLRNGSLSVAADPSSEVAQKNVVYFKETTGDPLAVLDDLKTSPAVVRYNTRFVIVTNYDELVATDTKTSETIGFPIAEIDQHFTFFLPWAGMEKAQYVAEAHADVKAAERMGKLFDELLHANPGLLDAPHGRHSLNIFFTRLLFCFFAEDTDIFEPNQFTNAVGSHTQADGSDVAAFLTDLFTALDTQRAEDKPKHLAAFPYVNGRLFTMSDNQIVPNFTRKAREYLIESGTLIWREINPDIFGSMFQAIVTPGTRSDLGQHYTSVPNILKTIEPLFLDNLKASFDAGYDSVKKLEALLTRMSEIKVFDPACGSGNFLVIAYKELRRLEHAILERLTELDTRYQVLYAESKINIESFFGIEIDDFAVEVAILSLWIAKHQMNAEFRDKFNLAIPLIPLRETGQIQQGNATRVDWNSVCPTDGAEVYLIGNPPYLGGKKQNAEQKADFDFVFKGRPYSKNLDYISLWFVKGGDFIRGSAAQLAFVTTNSVAQGEHVGLLFPALFNMGLEIGYAYTPFKWENNARKSATVTVSVVSLRNIQKSPKYIFTGDLRREADNINGYLSDGPNIFIDRRSSALSTSLPAMVFGSMPRDGGGLVISPEDRARLLAENPSAETYVRKYIGSQELLYGEERYCLWVDDSEFEAASGIPFIKRRFDDVSRERAKSRAASTASYANRPYRFVQISYQASNSIVIPKTSSERRQYLPIDYVGPDTVVSDLAFAAYNAELWVFALLSSTMHVTWTKAVAGALGTGIRYSNTIVYNNFPVPVLSIEAKEQLATAALRVLDVREYHCELTLADLYDPDKMPEDLRAAHVEVDAFVDSIYSNRGYETDEQRLADLFAMYERMTAEEAAKLPAKKTRSAKK